MGKLTHQASRQRQADELYPWGKGSEQGSDRYLFVLDTSDVERKRKSVCMHVLIKRKYVFAKEEMCECVGVE